MAKFLPEDTEETAAGHLHRRRQGIQSTQVLEDNLKPELEGQAKINIDQTQRVGIHLVSIEELNGMIATDQAGRLPITSQRGMKYIMCLYNYNSNGIIAEAIKSRDGPSLVEGYNAMYKRLIAAGIEPVIQRLDNEASKLFIKAITNKGLDYHLASPHDHRLNPAKRAIHTWNNHFISNLHGCDGQFPANQWC